MNEKFKDWPAEPAKWPVGPVRWVERGKRNLILQTYVWGEYTPEHIAKLNQGQQAHAAEGEFRWFDVPLEEE